MDPLADEERERLRLWEEWSSGEEDNASKVATQSRARGSPIPDTYTSSQESACSMVTRRCTVHSGRIVAPCSLSYRSFHVMSRKDIARTLRPLPTKRRGRLHLRSPELKPNATTDRASRAWSIGKALIASFQSQPNPGVATAIRIETFFCKVREKYSYSVEDETAKERSAWSTTERLACGIPRRSFSAIATSTCTLNSLRRRERLSKANSWS
mmetsp:Transcript_17154/g.28216  ORF Transcript_17154/g.28216 Transcript_17154/m.28216 type:complete len:212 (+) Transcript_17154:771-1406(+)